jgi:hypothetical protein
MPLARKIRHLYRTAEWEAARARVLYRAGDACERCGRPNGAEVLTVGQWWYDPDRRQWRRPARVSVSPDGEHVWYLHLSPPADRGIVGLPPRCGAASMQLVQIGVAHVRQTTRADFYQDDILAAWCRWCHLDYDRPQHKRTRQENKDQKRPLLTAVLKVESA